MVGEILDVSLGISGGNVDKPLGGYVAQDVEFVERSGGAYSNIA